MTTRPDREELRSWDDSLGLHDPQVWSARSVERGTPMAWLEGTLVVLWYAESGQAGPQARRQGSWYRHKRSLTFADMLASCRLQLWQHWLRQGGAGDAGLEDPWVWLLEYCECRSRSAAP